MPRKADEFEVLEKPKRAPRKRVAKPVDDKAEPKPKRTRKVTKKVPEETPQRKAPTVLKEQSASPYVSRTPMIVVGVLILVGVGSSAVVGLTDKGQIDVVTMIEERNRKAEERGEKVVSSSVKDQLPDGGLTPADVTPTPQASSTPQTTEPAAASTTPQDAAPQEEVAIDDETSTATST